MSVETILSINAAGAVIHSVAFAFDALLTFGAIVVITKVFNALAVYAFFIGAATYAVA